MKEIITTKLDDIFLDTDRIKSLNGIFNEIGDNISGKNNYLASKIYSVSYCSDLLLKNINDKLEELYKIASDINETKK